MWLEDDRGWALALQLVEGQQCPDCGQDWADATDPEGEFAWRGEITRCHACSAAARAIGKYETAGGDTRGLHVHVTKR